ncbi:ABC transporter ATP-binding protein/permease [Holzapfeliella floricola]|uniref:ABC transporter, ATP-binding permease protein n=1 Tax=Holzapfeliella floricola DSM 23037 = JCM 16512 TaxID=1423744 RepID=A0A0R2DU85_9LACO|nr:ABC transporter ATP-binding protein/permease [Holzapfeliella floricola]KRN04092.1 ABC transporter, ATP-binding permease protein [Holzapfeliella floricola DSM 23037 = JCM 16512]
MLELRHLKKYFHVGNTTTKALDDVSLSFRDKEFVSILGPSGSGKTTMLNIIGGLDKYDSGDLLIKNKSTKNFKDTDWDAYRNNSVGFIFQSYNLIGHLSILDNVELGMTLSGVSSEERTQKAKDALTRVGLGEHIGKKIAQLSGGQMQRVAIARAIANDPEILLADEPTGALDSQTSVQIMNLIKEISKDRLVIMVTHDEELAKDYSDRIVRFADGKIQDDTNPYDDSNRNQQFNLKRTKMSWWTALKLSFTNLKTKKGRTLLTAFASSIGIISIAIVLGLSNGFRIQIGQTQGETLSKFPITISQVATQTSVGSSITKDKSDTSKSENINYVIAQQDQSEAATHANKIDSNYLDYLTKINPNDSNNISYNRATGMNLLREVNGKIQSVKFSTQSDNGSNMSQQMSAMTGMGVSVFPEQLDQSKGNFLKDNYQLVNGEYPSNPTDVVLIVDKDNKTNINALKNLGFDVSNDQKLDYNQIIGTNIKLVNNNNYYQQLPTGNFMPTQDLTTAYNNSQNREVKVVGILKSNENSRTTALAPGIAYSDKLAQEIIQDNANSEIVKAQKESDNNVLTGQPITSDMAKTQTLAFLGGNDIPTSILIYTDNFKNKENVLTYLNRYNEGKSDEDKIIYTDMAGTVSSLTGGLMDGITYVLVAFAGISLVTSMIMIGILTYTSVIERTKEIGVLKALGARKSDITHVFDAETFILGLGSGVLGVGIGYLALFPINALLYQITNMENVANLNPVHAIILIIISTALTMLGGHIPSKMASKKDASTALRSE